GDVEVAISAESDTGRPVQPAAARGDEGPHEGAGRPIEAEDVVDAVVAEVEVAIWAEGQADGVGDAVAGGEGAEEGAGAGGVAEEGVVPPADHVQAAVVGGQALVVAQPAAARGHKRGRLLADGADRARPARDVLGRGETAVGPKGVEGPVR